MVLCVVGCTAVSLAYLPDAHSTLHLVRSANLSPHRAVCPLGDKISPDCQKGGFPEGEGETDTQVNSSGEQGEKRREQ